MAAAQLHWAGSRCEVWGHVCSVLQWNCLALQQCCMAISVFALLGLLLADCVI